MRNMKDSGIEWIGEIPEGWEVGKVKDYYKLQIGFTPDTKNELYYDDENGYDWVTISDLTNDKFVFETKNKISQVYINEQIPKIIPKNSLLYSFKLSVGKVSFTGKDMYSNEAIVSFLNSKNCNLKFLYYSSFMIRNNASENIYGAKILNQNLIKNANIIFPSLEEQELIADYLDNKVNEIDNIISKTKKTIEEYKKYKQSVITEAVTKGLNSNVEMKDSGIEWIGEIPKDWKVCKIKKLCIIQTGKTPPTENYEWFDGDLNWFTPGDFNEKYLLEKSSRMLSDKAKEDGVAVIVPKDSVMVVGIGATAGKIGYTTLECSCNQQITALITDKILPKYLMYWMISNQKNLRETALYTTLPIINNQTIGEYVIIYPNNQDIEQGIVEYLDKKCTEIDKLISKKEQLITELEQYKKSLIYECVTGKKEVSVSYAD